MLSNLKNFLDVLTQYSNLFLVIATVIYAWLTYQTVRLLKRQVTADIRVSKVYIRVSTVAKRNDKKILALNDLVKRPYGSLKETVFVFKVFVDFLNVSSGSGSIEQPKLIIKFCDSKFKLKVSPTSERMGERRQTIALAGGGFEKLDLEYFIAYNEKFISELKGCSSKIEYYLSYKDNFGKKHLVKINEVSGLK